MHTIMKNTWILLWVICLFLAGCGTRSSQQMEMKSEPAGDALQEAAAAQESDSVTLAENGVAYYNLVRAENADNVSVDLAVEFRRVFQEKTGLALTFGTDWVKPGNDPDMESMEILFGVTNRTDPETAASLGYRDWRIEREGNKIAILAKSPAALRDAADAFFKELVMTTEENSVTLNHLPISGTAFLAAGEVPDYPFGTLKGTYESSGSTVVVRVEKTNAEEFAAYRKILEEASFSLYDENTIDGNLYATYVNDETTVNISHVTGMGITRVVYEKRGDLCPLTDPCEEKYDTLLTGMKGETVVAAEGMGFIIRLADGSFCIIDGGMGDPDHVDSNKLMNILREQMPEGQEKPVIAAWLFSHLHGDHIGVFNCFSLDFHDQIVLERLVFNFPKEEEVEKSDSPYMLDNTIYRYTQFKKNLAEFYPDVPVLKVHTGNRFKLRNAEFEILYTLDDLYPKSILNGGMNESSVLYKMTIGGQTTLWTGDFAFNATDLVLAEFGDALKCDILQMAHHGINGTIPFYSRVDPTYALWPVWAGGYESMKGNEQNKWLIDNSNVKHIIVTGVGTWTIKLPYNPVDGTFDRTPTWRTKHPVYPALLGE